MISTDLDRSLAHLDPTEGTTNSLTGVSCPSASLCVAVDNAGYAVLGTVSSSFVLGVSLAGDGSGTVTGPSINCPTTCSASYPAQTTVTLTAVAASGSTFTGWSGSGCGAASTCTVTMSSAQGVTATFQGAAERRPAVGHDPRPLPMVRATAMGKR